MLLVFKFRHDKVCFLRHLLVDVLPLLVVTVYLARLEQGSLEVALHKQVNSFLTVLHSSGGIYPRSYFEHYVAHGYLPAH